MDVNIYTITSAKSPKRQSARIIYTLETQTSKGPADVTREERVEATANEAALLAIIKALGHSKAPCVLHIYTESQFVASGIDWMAGWKENGWKTAKGKEVKNKDLWQQLDELLQGHEVHLHCKEKHSFRKWMQTEISKKERKKHV